MAKKKTPKTESFIICILHRHGDEFSKSVGKIDVKTGAIDTNDQEALEKVKKRIEKWIDKKTKECRCKSYGNKCAVDVREAYGGLKSAMLSYEAEEIEEE